MTPTSARLGDLCKLYNGRTYRAADWKTEGLPIIRIQNLKDSAKGFNYWKGGFDGQVKVEPGNLLLAWSGTPGTSFGAHIWHGPAGVLNQHIFRVDLDEQRVTKEWAMHAINAQLDVLIGGAQGGVGLKHVTKSQVENLVIPVPSIDEQRRRCDRLAHARRLQTRREDSIFDLDRYLHSSFIEMFGDPLSNPKNWPKREIGEIVEKIESGWSPPCESRKAKDGESGVLKLGAVTWCEYNQDENKAYTGNGFDASIEVKPGDVLFARKNTYELVAAAAFVFETRGKLMMPDLIFRMNPRPNSNVLPIFFWKLLCNQDQRAAIQSLASGAAGSMPNISKEKLQRVSVIVPEFDLQQAFATRVCEIYKLRAAMNRSKLELGRLFDSLLHESFALEKTGLMGESQTGPALATGL